MATTWGDKVPASQLTNINTTIQYFDLALQLAPGETADVQFTVVFANPSDADALIYFYGTLDESSEDWDTEEEWFASILITDTAGATKRASIPVDRKFKIRVGIKRGAGTINLVSADMSARKDNVDLTK